LGLVKLFYGTDIQLIGSEKIDPDGNYIIVSNHRSYTDILVSSAAIPLQFRWLAKRSLFKIPVIGGAMRIAGYISIEREKFLSASRSLDRVKEVLEDGKSVWIFPEGTRTPEAELRRFKRGAFMLAKESEVPLLPVVLVNTDKIFSRPFIIKPTSVKVIVLDPVYYREFRKNSIDERSAMEKMMYHMRQIIQSIYNSYATRS
jgi:1-acyl-sn-glycerol-3-phosphate acyltransferase